MALLSLRLRRSLPTVSSLLHHHHGSLSHISTLPRSSSSLLQTLLPPPPSSSSSPSLQFQSRLFRTSSILYSRSRSFNDDSEIGPDTILFEGCDYNHWLITMDFPKDPKPTAEQMVDTYVQTCAKGLNISMEEAKQKIYACSTTTYNGFQAVMTEEESQKFEGLPGVVFILPDSYIDPVNKEYGGDKYINGTIIHRPPPLPYGRHGGRYGNRNRTYDRPPRSDMQSGPRNDGPQQNYPPQQNYQPQQNYGQPPQQSHGPPGPTGLPPQNYGPPQQNYGPPQQNYGLPQQNYGPSPQNFGPPPQSYGSPHPNYGLPQPSRGPPQQNHGSQQQNYPPVRHGEVSDYTPMINGGYGNLVGQGSFSTQERKDIPHGQQRDFGGDNQNSAPPRAAIYGQGVGATQAQGLGGSYGHGARTSYGGGNFENGSGQMFSPVEQKSGMQGEQTDSTNMGPTGVNQGR